MCSSPADMRQKCHHNHFKGNITNVSQLIINKITCFHSWCQIIYVSNYIGTIKITKNTHGKNILEIQTTTYVRNVQCVSSNITCTIHHGSKRTCILFSTVKYRASDLYCRYESVRLSVFCSTTRDRLLYTLRPTVAHVGKIKGCTLFVDELKHPTFHFNIGDYHVIESVVCKRFEYLFPDPANLFRFSGCLPF